jgi:hypothetical protein
MVGSNCTLRVVAWPGFRVTGKVAPDNVKPVPVTVAALMVTGAVPAEVKVTDCVDGALSDTLPNVKLAELMLKLGTAAFNCMTKISETAPTVAVSVAACAVATEDTVAVNPALVAFAGTVTVAGTDTAVLLLDRLTLRPLLGAAALSVTVQASVPEPVMDALLQERALNTPAACAPVPLRAITAAPPVEKLLVMVS